MALESDHCENSEIYCMYKISRRRDTISFYVQTPNEVVNRNSVTCI